MHSLDPSCRKELALVTTNPKSSSTANSARTRANGHIWMTAEQFFNAAEHIFQSNELNLNKFVFPLLVNYALSCELSLKASESIVKFSEVSPEGLISAVNAESAVRVRGHDLQEIYEKLSSPVKEALKAEFMATTKADLLPLLGKCSNYFISGRYPYEEIGGAYSLSDIRLLADGLLKSVRAYGVAQGH